MKLIRRTPQNRRLKARPKLYRKSRSFIDWLQIFLGVGAGVTVMVVVIFLLVKGNTFTLEEVEVTGHLEHLNEKEVVALAELPVRKNLFLINFFEVGRNVRRHPWVQNVTIRRRLPNAVQIDVVEQKAVAALHLEKGDYLVNALGDVFVKGTSKDLQGLPMIRGYEESDLLLYPHYTHQRLKETVAFINSYQKNSTLLPIREVQDDAGAGLTVLASDSSVNPPLLTATFFGQGDWNSKLASLEKLFAQAEQAGESYKEVDLHVLGKVFAR